MAARDVLGVAVFLFNTELTPAPYGLPTNQEIVLPLGGTTIVYWTSTQPLTFVGIAAIGGNVNGMVVVFSNQNTAATLTLSIAHDSPLASSLTNRCINAAGATQTLNIGGALMYRFNGTIGRWHQLGRA